MPRPSVVALAAAILSALACNDITRVAAPDTVQPSSLDNAQGGTLRRNLAVATFADATAQAAFWSGLLTDEFNDNGTGLLADRRVVSPANQTSGLTYPYDELAGARIDALQAIHTLEQYAPSPATPIGELFALTGYVELLYAEDLCSGVPVGVVNGDIPSYGPTLSTQALWQRAAADFDSAEAHAGGSDSVLFFARVGRARALLGSGALTAAAATVHDSVPTNFAYAMQYSAGTFPSNFVFNVIALDQAGSVSDGEGINGLPFVSAADPRVQTTTAGAALLPAMYPSAAAPVIIASGVEARLLEAEAALAAGSVSQWESILNTLRLTGLASPMDTLTADSTVGASDSLRVSVHFRERAFWLFGTAHRQGDLRRLIRQYGRSVDGVFPTGIYENGSLRYGEDITFVPFGEEFNPNFKGCLNRLP